MDEKAYERQANEGMTLKVWMIIKGLENKLLNN